MTSTIPCFGRAAELAQLSAELRDPRGAALLVIGQQGMGKTMLLDRFITSIGQIRGLKCGAVREEVTPSDTMESVLGLFMDRMYEAAQIPEGSLELTPQRLAQWRAFLNVFGVGDLIMSLRRDPRRNTREQFISSVERISDKLPEDGRVVFVVDPEKYLIENSDQDWAVVIRGLPDKVKLIFAQRPDDQLADSQVIEQLQNVIRIPNGELDILDANGYEELINYCAVDTHMSTDELKRTLAPYHYHPYATVAAINLLASGVPRNELPNDSTPIGFAASQWKRICRGGNSGENGDLAIRLFQSYALLEVPVPHDIILATSGLDSAQHTALTAHRFLGTLIRDEGGCQRIYHAILSDYIRQKIQSSDAHKYHRRAIDIYRQHLKRTPPGSLAAKRLAWHVRAVEGDAEFVRCFATECTSTLRYLGFFEEIETITAHALQYVAEDSLQRASLLGNLGNARRSRGDYRGAEVVWREALRISETIGDLDAIAKCYSDLGLIMHRGYNDLGAAEAMYRKVLQIYEQLGYVSRDDAYGNLGNVMLEQGDLEGAEAMYRRALEINEKLGCLEGVANSSGNLGNVIFRRGDLREAEAMYRKALEIDKKLGRLEGMANAYLALGNVMKANSDLGQAEAMYHKALNLQKSLGQPLSMAYTYANLGWVLKARGDLTEAQRMLAQARDLFDKRGAQDMVNSLQSALDELPN